MADEGDDSINMCLYDDIITNYKLITGINNNKHDQEEWVIIEPAR